MIILPRYDQNWCDVRDDDSDGDDQDLWLSASLDSPDDGSGSSSELLVVEVKFHPHVKCYPLVN